MAHILILEDDATFAAQLTAQVQQMGHKVSTQATFDAALAYIRQNEVDLVVADIFIKQDGKIEQKGGISLISKLRQIMGLSVPIVAISGAFSEDYAHTLVSTAKTVGATATLAKPFHPDEFDLVLQSLLDRVGC